MSPHAPPRGLIQSLSVYGPFRGPTGYDRHVRAFVRELDRQGVEVFLREFDGWCAAQLPDSARDPYFENLCRPGTARVLLQCCMPQQMIPGEPGIRVANHTMFEATRVPAGWVARHREIDLVLLPTASSRQAWIDSGLPADRIRLSPLGIDPGMFSPLPPPRRTPLWPYQVRFLNVAAFGPRKNLPGLLRVWKKATRRRDDAALLLKPGCYAPGEKQAFLRLLSGLESAAPVFFLEELLTDAEMPALFAAATHYISMSFGEGWDQPMMEAAAAGLRLIAPRHSAYTAYLDDSVATMLPSREVPVRWDGDPATGEFFRGANWWAPDEDAAVEAVRAAIEGRDAPAASARERVLTGFTWEQAALCLRTHLAELG